MTSLTNAISKSRTARSPIFEWWRSVDQLTLTFFLCLLGTGVILSMASSPAAAERMNMGDPFYFLYKHVVFVGAGLIGAIGLSFFSAINARRLGVLALLGSIVLLIAVKIYGYEVKGAQRWIDLGLFGLQPSEIAKPAFIVFTAWMFSVGKRDPGIPAVPIVFAVYLLLIFFFIQQPDFGQSFLLTLCFAAVFFFAGLSLGSMLFLMLGSGFAAFMAYMFMPHVQSRIQGFLSPGGEENYQTERALEAIRSGGFFGRGPGEGDVKFSIPDGHTDFIFAVTVEEFGFLISAFVILLLAGFVIRCFRNALKLNDFFCQLAVAGLATMIGMQTVINLYVNLNMAPPKGMTLPFISSGGSSMLACCFTVGLILAFTRRRPGAYGFGD